MDDVPPVQEEIPKIDGTEIVTKIPSLGGLHYTDSRLPRRCFYCRKQFLTNQGLTSHLTSGSLCTEKLQDDKIDPRGEYYYIHTAIPVEELSPDIRKRLKSPEVRTAYLTETTKKNLIKKKVRDDERKLREFDALKILPPKQIPTPSPTPATPDEERKIPLRIPNKELERGDPEKKGLYGTEIKKSTIFTGKDMAKVEVMMEELNVPKADVLIREAVRYVYDKFSEARGEKLKNKESDKDEGKPENSDTKKEGDVSEQEDQEDGGKKMGGSMIDFGQKPNYWKKFLDEIQELKEMKMVETLRGTLLGDSPTTTNTAMPDMTKLYNAWLQNSQMMAMMQNMNNSMSGNNNSNQNNEYNRRLEEENKRIRDQMLEQHRELQKQIVDAQNKMQEMVFKKESDDKIARIEQQIGLLQNNTNRSTSDEIQRWLTLHKDKDVEIEKMRAERESESRRLLFDEIKFLRDKVDTYSKQNGISNPLSEDIFNMAKEKLLTDIKKGIYDPNKSEDEKSGKMFELIGNTVSAAMPAVQEFIASRRDERRMREMQVMNNPVPQPNVQATNLSKKNPYYQDVDMNEFIRQSKLMEQQNLQQVQPANNGVVTSPQYYDAYSPPPTDDKWFDPSENNDKSKKKNKNAINPVPEPISSNLDYDSFVPQYATAQNRIITD